MYGKPDKIEMQCISMYDYLDRILLVPSLEGPLHWPCGDCGGCPAEDGNFILTHGHVEEGRLSDSPVSKFVKAPGGPPTWGYWPSSLRE